MEDHLERLAAEYQDLYVTPTEARISELDFKIADLDWEGLYLAAPAKVGAAAVGLPVLALMKRSDLEEWEARLRKNSALIFTELTSGNVGMRPLYSPPVKKMKPQPDVRGRKPEPKEGFTAGAIRQVIAARQPESLSPGTYSIALISWNRLSNQRLIQKEGKPKIVDPVLTAATWPWEQWVDTKKFQATPGSPILDASEGAALIVDGKQGSRIISGTVAAKARGINLIPPDPIRKNNSGIHAGINVYLLLFSLDKYPPESTEISVPILGSAPVHVGDAIKGWFTIPFPFKPSPEDRMLYAVVDGGVIGPIRVSGENP